MSPAAARTFTSLALALVVAGGVASCTPAPEATPTQTAVAPAPEPSPSQTAAGDPGAPVDADCDDLLDEDAVYAFNPNTAFDESYVGPIDSNAATAVELGGIACSWVNQSSGDRFTISVAHPSTEQLSVFESESASAPRALEYDGTFDGDDDAASTSAVVGPYWVTGNFEFFVEQGDVTPIMLEVIDELDD